MANGPAFKKNYVHRTPFRNIDVYSLCCSVLHLNLDPSLERTNPSYCRNDGQPSRVQKMLQPIKYTPRNGSDQNSLNSKDDDKNDQDGGWFGSKLKGYLNAPCYELDALKCLYIQEKKNDSPNLIAIASKLQMPSSNIESEILAWCLKDLIREFIKLSSIVWLIAEMPLICLCI